MTKAWVYTCAIYGAVFFAAPSPGAAQHVHDETASSMSAADMKAMAAHMEMTPHRSPTRADSIRAAKIVSELRTGIAKYRDVRVAVEDGFKQFAPQIKNQPVYHFTRAASAIANAFTFNAARPTSLLYKKDGAGNLVLIGAMYTAPRTLSAEKLDERVPLGIAQWHKHVNWCLPPKGDEEGWLEKRNGRPVFGPLGVSTREECDAAGGRFQEEVFGWMVHANVFASDDPRIIWGDEHMMSGREMLDARR
ncbi:MAG TPA: hypothetical protein VHM24_13590 [Gemmatimonadaceae bacterium]|nr:hypothetical protein [Gemmatimonadaceae bacterium]